MSQPEQVEVLMLGSGEGGRQEDGLAGVRIGREKQMLFHTGDFARRVDGIDSITNGY